MSGLWPNEASHLQTREWLQSFPLQRIICEFTCPLCQQLFREAHAFSGCGHTFCRSCVLATLEGPGIAASQCPVCQQPCWKKDLVAHHQYQAIADLLCQWLQAGDCTLSTLLQDASTVTEAEQERPAAHLQARTGSNNVADKSAQGAKQQASAHSSRAPSRSGSAPCPTAKRHGNSASGPALHDKDHTQPEAPQSSFAASGGVSNGDGQAADATGSVPPNPSAVPDVRPEQKRQKVTTQQHANTSTVGSHKPRAGGQAQPAAAPSADKGRAEPGAVPSKQANGMRPVGAPESSMQAANPKISAASNSSHGDRLPSTRQASWTAKFTSAPSRRGLQKSKPAKDPASRPPAPAISPWQKKQKRSPPLQPAPTPASCNASPRKQPTVLPPLELQDDLIIQDTQEPGWLPSPAKAPKRQPAPSTSAPGPKLSTARRRSAGPGPGTCMPPPPPRAPGTTSPAPAGLVRATAACPDPAPAAPAHQPGSSHGPLQQQPAAQPEAGDATSLDCLVQAARHKQRLSSAQKTRPPLVSGHEEGGPDAERQGRQQAASDAQAGLPADAAAAQQEPLESNDGGLLIPDAEHPLSMSPVPNGHATGTKCAAGADGQSPAADRAASPVSVLATLEEVADLCTDEWLEQIRQEHIPNDLAADACRGEIEAVKAAIAHADQLLQAHAVPGLMEGTERSLGEIDRTMIARGYRCSKHVPSAMSMQTLTAEVP